MTAAANHRGRFRGRRTGSGMCNILRSIARPARACLSPGPVSIRVYPSQSGPALPFRTIRVHPSDRSSSLPGHPGPAHKHSGPPGPCDSSNLNISDAAAFLKSRSERRRRAPCAVRPAGTRRGAAASDRRPPPETPRHHDRIGHGRARRRRRRWEEQGEGGGAKAAGVTARGRRGTGGAGPRRSASGPVPCPAPPASDPAVAGGYIYIYISRAEQGRGGVRQVQRRVQHLLRQILPAPAPWPRHAQG